MAKKIHHGGTETQRRRRRLRARHPKNLCLQSEKPLAAHGPRDSFMPVTVRIPTYLASFAEGRNSLGLEGSPKTVSEALKMLWSLYPGLHDRILDEQGEV